MGKYKSFSTYIIGSSHTKQGKVCQDRSHNLDKDNYLSIVAVADGHGDNNCFRSDTGAAIAILSTIDGINRFVDIHKSRFYQGSSKKRNFVSFKNKGEDDSTRSLSQEEWNKNIRDLIQHIIATWQIKTEEDFTTRPFSQDELELADEKHRKIFCEGRDFNKAYGTTLLACAITDHYWLGIHIGDGRITALYPDGTFDQPVPWDEKCYLNVTTSICDNDALKRSRHYFSLNNEKQPPIAVFLCSDGIDDNYPVDENEKYLYKLYRTIAITFAEDGFESTCNQLKDLANSFATKGKGDDTSIAGFVDMDGLRTVFPILKKQAEDEANKETENDEKKSNITFEALEAIKKYEKQNNHIENNIDYSDFVSNETKRNIL